MMFIFGLSLFTSLFMSGITYLLYRKGEDKNFLHQCEFWLGMTLSTSLYYFVDSKLSVLNLMGWIWPLRSMDLNLSDFAEKNLFKKWHLITLVAGGFISFALSGYNVSFIYSALPFSVATCSVGLDLCRSSYHKSWGPLLKFTTSLFAAYFLYCLSYPFTYNYALYFNLIFGTLAAGTLLASVIQTHSGRHDSRMEEILKERSEKFLGQSKFSELGMMSAGIAHEINNPLAVIQARTTQLLRIYRKPDRQKDLADGLQQILYTSERINKTIQGVREFVHHDENGPAQEIILKDLIDDVLAFCGQRMKNHGVNLRFYGLEDRTVVGNKIQLEQIILNLLNNSFDAIEFHSDKWIEVSCHEKNSRVQLFFKDSGQGIPKEISSRMMEPFFSTKDIGKGTGLGLALAQGIAEKHGGSLQYMDDCPHTTFKLELPRSKEDWNIPLH